jgi:hypothetical protein
MPIGDSKGAFFEDDFRAEAHPWWIDPKMEDVDNNTISPGQVETNKQLENVELTELGGIEAGYKVPSNDNDIRFDWDYRNKPYTKDYDTKLSYSDEEKYRKTFGPDASVDYDMRGYFKANPKATPNQEGVHYPDTYKKPNHPTFSMDSQYNGVDGNWGGVWGTEDDKDTFVPSSTNLKNMSKDELQDYFKRVEPNAILKLPTPQIEDRRNDPEIELTKEQKEEGSSFLDIHNKLLDRSYTALEKAAGMGDLDKSELDLIVKAIQRGLTVKDEKPIKK